MTDYKANSHRSKADAEKKKVEKVVKGRVRTKKKSNVSRFADVFVSEDVSNVKSYIVMDVIIPAIKDAVANAVKDGIDMILFGKTDTKKKKSSAGYVSYRDYSKHDDRHHSSRGGNLRSVDEVIFDTKDEALEVLDRMDELIETYEVVSVADFYDLVGITCDYTDNNYGWTTIKGVNPVRARYGYILSLPKARPID